MNHIFLHISYLLLRRDCVTVPGFGAFIATDHYARVDREKGVILAPVRRIMFNQAVVSDDGLLTTSVARKLSISFEEAREIVAREVDVIRRSLTADGILECGSLGHLEMTEEGRIIYAPLLLSIGYGNIPMTVASSGSGSDEILVGEEEVDPDGSERLDKKTSYYFFRRSGRIAAAVAFFFVLALAVLLNPIPRDTREERASVVPVEVLIPSKGNVESVKESKVVTNLPARVEKIPEETPRDTVRSTYSHYLIVGTFSSRKEAERFIDLRSSEEFPLLAIESKKLTRVALACSDNRDSLQRQLNSSRVLKTFPGSWIWTPDK